MKPKTCEHKKQHYIHCMTKFGCFSWNECNDCGQRLNAEISKAEENKK